MTTLSSPLRTRIINSTLWAAYGDALGFASELVDRFGLFQRTGFNAISETKPWNYRAGGRYGIPVKLPAGTYSDDTQLRLATCRALGTGAKFDVDSFSKVELPVFLSYALGAGRGTKTSAANLVRDNISWFANFYNSSDGNYLNGGGNGAAMRIQPHVWAASQHPDRTAIALNVARNTICTHGHPRALIGALFHAYQLLRALVSGVVPEPETWAEDLGELEFFPKAMSEDDYLGSMWIPEWERRSGISFSEAFIGAIGECRDYLRLFKDTVEFSETPAKAYLGYLERIGGFDSASKGSGTKTAILATALAWLHREVTPDVALKLCANALGSDTDTIATLTGAILGATSIQGPDDEILDRSLLLFEAGRMHDIAAGQKVDTFPYPSLLEWNPPRTGVDAYGRFEAGFAVAGLGPVMQVSGEEFASKDIVWRWVRTEAGQTLLIKSRAIVGQIEPSQISSYIVRNEKAPSAISPPAPTRARMPVAEPSREEPRKVARNEVRSETTQVSLFSQDETKRSRARGSSIDEWLITIEKSGFSVEIIGRAVVDLLDGPEGIERAAGFIGALARSKRFQRVSR